MSDESEFILDAPEAMVACVVATGCVVAPSGVWLDDALGRVGLDELPHRGAVRDLLRHGRYKPTGRGKPACEYLLRTAREGAFPRISNVVDAGNLASLEAQLPISLVDLELAGTRRFTLRRGREGESYVFNPTGQELSLRDLLLVATLPDDAPCATPVKDSQRTKTHAGSHAVLGIVYAPAALRELATTTAERMAALLAAHAGARTTVKAFG